VGGELKALLAVALLALSYHHVWFSQNARGYTGLLFWTLTASWVLLLAMQRGQSRLWVWYAVVTALGVFTNMTMLFVTAGHFLFFLIKELRSARLDQRKLFAGIFLGFYLAGLLTFLLHALVLPQLLLGLGEVSTVPLWKTTGWALLEFAKGMEIGFSNGIAAGMVLLVFGVGLVTFWKEEPAVIVFLLIPSVLGAGVVIGLGHHLWPRFFFFSFGFACLILVGGCLSLGRILGSRMAASRRTGQTVGVTLCLGAIFVSALSLPAAYAPKQDFGGALEFVEAKKQPGDVVTTVGLASFTFEHYYQTGWVKIEDFESLASIRSAAKRTWLLYTFETHVRSVYPEIMSAIEGEFRVVNRFEGTVGDGAILVCLAENSS
jgi:4-amino-4-deoxy-L-arabinose transferase-like glycosyltransferase